MPTQVKKILFILNPVAGIRRLSDLEGHVRQHLDLAAYDYDIRVTSRQGEALQLTREALGAGCGAVVAVGGDGTINEIAKGIEGSDAVLGIIPNGSGNGLARHLGIPLDIAQAIRVLNGFHWKTIDTANLNGNTYVSIAGVGFDARVANRYRFVRRRGFYGYFRIVVLQYFSYKERDYVLTVDGLEMKKTALFITVANSNQFGFGTIIAPGARLDDGLLDVVIVRKFPFTELPHILQLLFTHRIDKSPFVETFRGKEIAIVRTKGRYVNLDGEAVRTDPTVHIRVNPSSLKVIVPKMTGNSTPGAQ